MDGKIENTEKKGVLFLTNTTDKLTVFPRRPQSIRCPAGTTAQLLMNIRNYQATEHPG